jgi:hypothetical protein
VVAIAVAPLSRDLQELAPFPPSVFGDAQMITAS